MDRLPFDPYDFFGYIASGLLAVVGMELIFGFPQVLGRDLKVVEIAILILAVYVAGQAIATPAKFLLEDTLVHKLLKSPSINLFREKSPRLGRLLFPRFFKPLPPAIRKRILEAIGPGAQSLSGEDLFMTVRYDARIRNDERVMQKLDSFRDKYGFNRNLSFTALAVAAALLLKAQVAGDPVALRYGTLAFAAGVLLFYRYLKFFRQYSYEMFNCYGGGR
jgi:hypothetical protein